MIDINELRRLTQAALAGPDGISLNWIKLLQDFQQKVSPAAVFELLDRLEAAEKSDAESIAMYRNARDARDDLRAKIESTWRAIEARTTGAQPAANFADAYQGAMEEVAIWKKRALEAENLNRKFVAEINGPTYMGEPAHPKPDCGEAGHDEGRCGNRQCLPGAQPAPSVPDGWKLVPTVPKREMRAAWDSSPICEDDDAEFRRAYSEMLAAASEAKP